MSIVCRDWSWSERLSVQRFKDDNRITWEQENIWKNAKVLLEIIFSKMIWANKKAFIFWQGSYTVNALHSSLLKSFALSIYSRDPMKNSNLGYFYKSEYSQMYRKLQPWWFFGRWLLCFVLQVEISYSHITSHIFFAKAFK